MRWAFTPNINPKSKQSSNRIRFSTPTSGGRQNIKTSSLGSSRQKHLAEGLSQKVVYLISDATIPGAINHYESSRRKWDSWCSQRGFIPIRCDLNPILEFLNKIFHQRLTYNTICCCRSPISAYHDSKGPFSVGKHAPISSLTINRVPQPRYSYRWGVEKVLTLLNSLDSERIGLKMLTYIVTLVLTRSSRAQQRCYLNICYLIKHSSGYTSPFNKLKKATRKVNLTPTIDYLNFSSNKNL